MMAAAQVPNLQNLLSKRKTSFLREPYSSHNLLKWSDSEQELALLSGVTNLTKARMPA